MPCCELFDHQDEIYKQSVLPKNISRRIAIEAGSDQTWYKYVGLQGKIIGINRFGASAPYQEIYKHFGLTAEEVAEAALGLL